MRRDIVVRIAVSRGSDEELSNRLRSVDRIFQALAVSASAPRVGRERESHSNAILDALDRAGCRSASASGEELAPGQLHLLADAHDAHAIVSHSADGSRAVRSVALVIHGITAVGDGVDAIHVVDVAVSIVVLPVAGNFSRVHPHIRGNVGVVVVDARVDHKHGDVARSRRLPPGAWLASVWLVVHDANLRHAPKLSEARVVRRGRLVGIQHAVGLGVLDLDESALRRDGGGERSELGVDNVLGLVDLEVLDAQQRQPRAWEHARVDFLESRRGEDGAERGVGRRGGDAPLGLELDENVSCKFLFRLSGRVARGHERRHVLLREGERRAGEQERSDEERGEA